MVKTTGLGLGLVRFNVPLSMYNNDTAHTLSRRTAATSRFSKETVDCQKQTAPSFANNPTRPGFYLASIHQMAPPKRSSTHLIIALLLIYRPRKDERLSWPSLLTCKGRFTHISGHPSAKFAGEIPTFHPLCYATGLIDDRLDK